MCLDAVKRAVIVFVNATILSFVTLAKTEENFISFCTNIPKKYANCLYHNEKPSLL